MKDVTLTKINDVHEVMTEAVSKPVSVVKIDSHHECDTQVIYKEVETMVEDIKQAYAACKRGVEVVLPGDIYLKSTSQ